MKKTLFFEARTKKEQKEYNKKVLQRCLNYASKSKWEEQQNDIIELAEKKGIKLN